MFLVMVLVLTLAIPAFATNWGDTYNDYDYTITNQGGSVGPITVSPTISPMISPTISPVINPSITVKPEINVKPVIDTNINIGGGLFSKTLSPEQNQNQGQLQGQDQKQGQVQGQNNDQEIAPVQTVTIKTERPLVAIPTTSIPELNFGNGHMIDVGKMLPKFKGVTLLKDGDTIHTVVDVVANVPFKKLYKTILALAKDHTVQNSYMRFQVIRAEGQKSWNFGVPLSGGGSNTAGIAGSASSATSIGGTKAHNLFTVMVVNVIPE